MKDDEYVLENTNAFKVVENGYIIVNNNEKFNHFGVFEFYVSIVSMTKRENYLLKGMLKVEIFLHKQWKQNPRRQLCAKRNQIKV